MLWGAEDTYDKREAGELLFDLADCKAPAIFELGETPPDSREENRPVQYKGGLLALTELGRALWACEEDFSRHNTIKRWWGGTELTNERLWRWDDESRSLIAP
ncbi:hypothetical protein [Bradyrhizobium hipponense]|uniref:hypothetical protein n=1 Tax=Bradyrhizobium hipponense TaxID=2605638 RepID=UPI001F29F75C|nr:hypothetical protein [Bradyrhizobium hipponense]